MSSTDRMRRMRARNRVGDPGPLMFPECAPPEPDQAPEPDQPPPKKPRRGRPAMTGAERMRRMRARRRAKESPAADLLSPGAADAAPRPGERYSEWADRALVVTAGPHRGGRWRSYRWQREPLDIAGAGGRIVVVSCASQAGKTSVGLALGAGRMLAGEPVLFVQPAARPAGTQFARERLEPLLSTSPLVEYLHSERAGGLARSSAVMFRTLKTGGSASLAGAESAAQLAARGAACVVLDEVARFPLSAGNEGPPVSLALERTAAWRDTRAVLLLSSPVLDGDPFDVWFTDGDVRLWFVPCAGCGHWWAPEWEHVSDGDPPSIDCPECGFVHPDRPPAAESDRPAVAAGRTGARFNEAAAGDPADDTTPARRGDRLELLDLGEWRPTRDATDPEVVSFRMPRWLSPASTLAACIADHERATRKRTLAVWTRTCAALPAEPDTDTVDVSDVQARLEDWPDGWPPADVELVTIGADVQQDRIEAVVLGWPRGREWSAVLDYRVLRGRPVGAEVWRDLQELLDDTEAKAAAVDCGYLPDRVTALARRDTRVVPVVGRAGVRPSITRPGPAGRFFVIGVDGLKRTVLDAATTAALRLPAAPWCSTHWLRGLFSEREVAAERSGQRVMVWESVYRRNEPLDTCVYATAAADLIPKPATHRPRASYAV